MAKEDGIFNDSKIKYKGIADLSLFYNKLREWLMDLKYSDPKDTEIKYSEKIKPSGKTIEVLWEVSKSEQAEYFKIKIGIKMYLVNINEAETEINGRKIKLDNGDFEIKLSSSLIRNANNKWDENSMMFKIYERYIIPRMIEHYKIETYKDSVKIMDEIKNFFNLYRF